MKPAYNFTMINCILDLNQPVSPLSSDAGGSYGRGGIVHGFQMW